MGAACARPRTIEWEPQRDAKVSYTKDCELSKKGTWSICWRLELQQFITRCVRSAFVLEDIANDV